MSAPCQALYMQPDDDVANVLAPAEPGGLVTVRPDGRQLTATTRVPRYHKIALRDVAARTDVVRHGVTIGTATQDIAAGAHVHIHNLVSLRAAPVCDTKR